MDATDDTTPEARSAGQAPDAGRTATRERDRADSQAIAARHMRGRRRRRNRNRMLQAGLLITVLLAWWAITAAKLLDPMYLPAPGAVWDAFVRGNTCYPISEGAERQVCGYRNYYLWEHLIASLQRMGVGIAAAVVIGPIIGFLIGTVGWINTSMQPVLNFIRSLPPLAYLSLLMVWFGIGEVSKFWLLFLAAFPPVALATINGIRGIRTDRIHAAQSMGASRWQVTTQVMLPSALPETFSGIRIGIGFAWTTVVAAELVNGIPGIGGIAFAAGENLDSALVVACIILIGVCALIMDGLVALLSRLLVPWQGKA